MNLSIRTLCVTWAVSLMGLSAWAQPAGYPNKPIRMIVPAGSGDSCDILSRVIGPRLGERLGQAIVVDNKPGSSGQLGLTLIKQAPNDGHTLRSEEHTSELQSH